MYANRGLDTSCSVISVTGMATLTSELLASVASPSDPGEPPLPVLIQGLLSLLAFGVKSEQAAIACSVRGRLLG